MKKNALLIMAAVAALTACNEMVEDPTPENEGSANLVEKTFTATIENGDATKTELGAGNLILWQKDDDISVIDKATGTNTRLTLESGEGTTRATFKGSVPESENGYYFVYPYDDDITYNAETDQFRYAFSSIFQTPKEGSFDRNIALMVGESDKDTENIAFKNVMSFIKFTIGFSCEEIIIRSKDWEEISVNTGYVDLGIDSETGLPSITKVTQYEGENLANLSSYSINPGTYYIGVLPQEAELGFTLEFYNVSGEDYVKEAPHKTNFVRSEILNLGAFDYYSLTGKDFYGSGTETDPYIIATVDDIMRLMKRVYDGAATQYVYYKQVADINLMGRYLNIGNSENPFMGYYDGTGHSIILPHFNTGA